MSPDSFLSCVPTGWPPRGQQAAVGPPARGRPTKAAFIEPLWRLVFCHSSVHSVGCCNPRREEKRRLAHNSKERRKTLPVVRPECAGSSCPREDHQPLAATAQAKVVQHQFQPRARRHPEKGLNSTLLYNSAARPLGRPSPQVRRMRSPSGYGNRLLITAGTADGELVRGSVSRAVPPLAGPPKPVRLKLF